MYIFATSKTHKMKLIDYLKINPDFGNQEIDIPENPTDITQPYLYEVNVEVNKLHNPDYDMETECECGHSYYRHFDPYEANEAVGCKYCGCFHFSPK